MIALNNLKPNKKSRRKSTRLWRGNASGHGTFCGRWMNGQNSRSWGWVPDWFEWGQTPLFRRMPKLKGFSNAKFMKHFNVVNLSQLQKLADAGISTISKEVLLENKVLRRKNLPIKLLGKWEISSSITLSVNAASVSAKEAVEKAWGTVELV